MHFRSSRLPPLPPHLWPYLFPRFLATSRCLVLSPASPAPLSLSNGCYASVFSSTFANRSRGLAYARQEDGWCRLCRHWLVGDSCIESGIPEAAT